MNETDHDPDNPYAPRALKVRDVLHDLQLLRGQAIVNARTAAELGPLPSGGLPVEPKRKPKPWPPTAPHTLPETETEDDTMKLSYMAAASALSAAAALAAACQPSVQADGQEGTTKARDTGEYSRRSELKQRAMASPESSGVDHGIAQAQSEADDTFSVLLGDISVRIHSTGCESLMETLVECPEGAKLNISTPTLKSPQTLQVGGFYLNPRAALYRGPLDGSYRKDGISIIVSDVNGDGIEDLAIQTGRDGSYGSPSYEVYLYNRDHASYFLSKSFSNLTIGHLGMFAIKDGKIIASSKSGCCEHIDETYVVAGDSPKLIEVVTETATDSAAAPTRTVKRLVDGKLQVVRE